MLAAESQGLALSFTDTFFHSSTGHYGSARVKHPAIPANNYNSHPFGLLTYSGASKKWVRGPSGLLIESDPALTLPYEWDENGDLLGIRVEEQRTNLQVQSMTIGGTGWTLIASATVDLNNAIAPDGTTTATLISGGGQTSGRVQSTAEISVSASTNYTASVFLKQGTTNLSRVAVYNGAVSTALGGVAIAWSNGVPSTSSSDTGTSNINYEELPDGWWRLSFTFSTGEATTAKMLVYPHVTGTGTATKFAWGPQLEQGSFPTSYIPTAGSTVTRAADVIGPALDKFPWNEGNGVLTVNDEEVEPSDDGTILLLEPPDGDTHIRTVKWIPEAA